MSYTQELEVAVRELLEDVIHRYPEIIDKGFTCPFMQKLADLIDLAYLPNPVGLEEGEA